MNEMDLKAQYWQEFVPLRKAMMERITAAGNGAPQRFMTLAESAMAGNAEAKAEIESFFGLKVASMRDLYAVMNAAAELMTKSEIARAGADAEQALAVGHDPTHDADAYLANRLKAIRKAAGLTQDELARKSGVTLCVLQKYENGTNRLLGARAENVLRIARALDVTVEELIG